MMLRIVAGLSLQSRDLANVREPTGSPQFTYERMISFRISRGLSSRPASAFPLIALYIASGNDWVNGWLDSQAKFDREMFFKSLNECACQIINGRPSGKEFCQPPHLPSETLHIRHVRRQRQHLVIERYRHRPMLQKAVAHSALRASDNLPAAGHQFIA